MGENRMHDAHAVFGLSKDASKKDSRPDIRRERLWLFALLGLLAAYLLVFSIINFCGFTDFMTADIYSDTLVARYMWEKKSLFPEGWCFGNQYYVVATPVLSAVFYGLTGSMNRAMAMATTVMTIALLAACYWLFRSFLDRTQAVAGLLALVSSVLSIKLSAKHEAQIFFLMASYYSCYLLTAVIVRGDYVQALFQEKKLLCSSFFLGIFLSFATGMQSIRQTCIMVLPLFAFEGLRILAALLGRRPVNWMPALRVACVTAANLGGLLFMSLLQVPSVSIYAKEAHPLSQRLYFLEDAVCRITGFSYINQFGSRKIWFVLLFSIATVAVVAVALWRTAARLQSHQASILDALIALCTLSLLAVIASTIVLPKITIRSIYLFMWYFLVCLAVVSLVDADMKRGKRLALALLCIAAALNLRHSYANDLRHALTKGQDTYFPYYVDVADELEKSDYEILYGPVGAGSDICSFTDGKVICSPWHNGLFQSIGYIYPQDLCGPEDNGRAVYLIPDEDLEEARRLAEEKHAELTLVRQFETMALYTSSAQLMQPTG